MKTTAAIFISLVLLAIPVSGWCQTWSLYDDFSATENPNGAWAFGWRMGASGPFNLYTDNSPLDLCIPDPDFHPWSFNWNPISLIVAQNAGASAYECNGCTYPPHTVYYHPGPDGQQGIVRWTAPDNMEVHYTAHFLAVDTGWSIVRVYFGNTELWSATLYYGDTADYSFTTDCATGDRIDTAIDAITFYDDSVVLDVTIATTCGACCFGTECQMHTAEDCEAAGGRFVGEGVPCDPNPCENTPVENATWGRVKTLYR